MSNGPSLEIALTDPAYAYTSTGNSSTTNLSASNSYTFTGTWEKTSHPDLMVNLYADQATTILIQLSQNGTNIDSTITKTGTANANDFTTAVKGARYVRVIVSTASLTTTVFRLQTQFGVFRQGNSPLNGVVEQDADALVVRNISEEITIAQGKFTGYSIVNKFGFNPDVDTASVPEDIWDLGGVYTGFPSTSGETITVVSDSANDTSAGSGARTIRITGLDANYAQQTEDFTLNGTTPVTGVKTFTRVHTAQTLTSGGSNTAFNAGNITIRHTTTVANVFLYMRAGVNQTNSSGYTIPAGYTGYVRAITAKINSAGGSTASIDYSIWTQPSLKTTSPRLRRPNTTYYGDGASDMIYGGLVFSEKTDLILRVNSSAANNTPISGGYDLILVQN